MTTHTPGPWAITDDTLGPGQRLLQISSAFGHIAHVYGANNPDDETMPNAHLLAAAPDLLEAAKRARCACSVVEMDSGHRIDCWMPALAMVIIKAEGGVR